MSQETQEILINDFKKIQEDYINTERRSHNTLAELDSRINELETIKQKLHSIQSRGTGQNYTVAHITHAVALLRDAVEKEIKIYSQMKEHIMKSESKLRRLNKESAEVSEKLRQLEASRARQRKTDARKGPNKSLQTRNPEPASRGYRTTQGFGGGGDTKSDSGTRPAPKPAVPTRSFNNFFNYQSRASNSMDYTSNDSISPYGSIVMATGGDSRQTRWRCETCDDEAADGKHPCQKCTLVSGSVDTASDDSGSDNGSVRQSVDDDSQSESGNLSDDY